MIDPKTEIARQLAIGSDAVGAPGGDRFARHLTGIYEKPITLASRGRAVTEDIRRDVEDAGRSALARLRDFASAPGGRAALGQALDGLDLPTRSPIAQRVLDFLFEQILGQPGLEAQTSTTRFMPPAFVAARALPLAHAGGDSALPPGAQGAVLEDTHRVLISADLGFRDLLMVAQCCATTHFVLYARRNGVTVAPGDVVGRTNRALFQHDDDRLASMGENATDWPVTITVLDQGQRRTAVLAALIGADLPT